MGSKIKMEMEDESVELQVTHSNLKTFSSHIRFSLQMTIEAVKDKLWKKCGTSVNSMCLELYDDMGSKISDLSDNSRPFSFYSPQNGFRVHVIDLDPSSVTSGGWLEDTSLVEKYKISDENYEKRDDLLKLVDILLEQCTKPKDGDLTAESLAGTYKKFKERLASQNPSTNQTKVSNNYMEDHYSHIKVGDRCQVEPGEKRGIIKYVGQAENLGPGFWVGVQYDEPLGKHDGMVKGTRYFDCLPSHGGIVRPDKVKVGDYPERDPFEDEEI